MDANDLDEIHRFTQSVGQTDLYAYLEIEQSADKSGITHALQVRRSWAQGQQANPKYRQEALWLIKNIKLVKTALIDESARYLKDIAIRDERAKLDTLSMFIKGTLAEGELTARGEEAIQAQAKEMGLPESLVIRRIGEILAEQDAEKMAGPPSDPPPSFQPPIDLSAANDLYEILDTPPDSDVDTLEEAYRRRYRWARQLRDTEQSSRIYAQIDEAWRVLKDPQKRAEYDAERAQSQPPDSPSDSLPSTDNTVSEKGFLPPPPPTIGIALPMPSVEQHLERVHAIENGEAAKVDTGAPSISMPSASPERDAPPPPSIPMPGDDSNGDLIEEPEVTFEDLSSEDGSAHFDLPPTETEPVEEDEEDDVTEPPAALENTLDFMSFGDDSQEDEKEAQDEDPFQMMSMYAGMDTEPTDDESSEPAMMSFDMGLNDDETESNEDEKDSGDFMSLGQWGGSSTEEPEDQATHSHESHDGLTLGIDTHAPGGSGPSMAQEDRPVLSAGQIFNEFAVLKVDGPRVIRIRTGAHPFPVRITVRNEGEGPMPGTVSSTVPWVHLSPKTLDPNRVSQVIEALVEPDGISGNAGKATVTIETDHGETRSISIDVLKHIVSPVMMFVAALSLVGIVGLFAGLYLSGVIGTDLKAPSRTILAINVDPPAGEVYVNDELVGNQGTLSLIDTFPINEEFQIRVELDGFEPFIRDLTVSKGTQFRVEADLELRDLVNFEPPPGALEADLDLTAVDALIEQKQTYIDACFTRNLRTAEPFKAEIVVNAVVTTRGFIQGIDFGEANFKSPAVETCLRRQLRAIHLPLLAGEFARFSRSMGTEIRPVTVLNDRDNP